MSVNEATCSYAVMILHDDGIAVTFELKIANVEVESYWPSLFAKLVEKRNIGDLIFNAGASGGGAPVAAAAGGDAAPAAKEKKNCGACGSGFARKEWISFLLWSLRSWKTYTMLGTVENPGVMVLAIKDLFTKIRQRSCDGNHVVQLSNLKVYNETVRDSLSPGRPLELREDKQICLNINCFQKESGGNSLSIISEAHIFEVET